MTGQISITTDFIDDGGPIEPKLKLFAEAGFKYIHWCEHWIRDVLYEDFYIEGLEKLLNKYKIKLLDTHNAYIDVICSPAAYGENERKRGVRLMKNRIHFTEMLGGDCVIVHPGPYSDTDLGWFKKCWDNLSRSIEEAVPLCKKNKLRIAIENVHIVIPAVDEQMDMLFKKFPPSFLGFCLKRRWKFLKKHIHLFKKFPPSFLGFCFDSGHANIAKRVDMLEKYGARTYALHLHDNYGISDEHALPGKGTVDWDRIIKALKTHKYKKPLNFELALRDPNADPSEFLNKAYVLGIKLAEKL